MPFQTLKPDRNNVPRDFAAEQKAAPKNLKAANLKASPDFNDPQYLASAGEAEITPDIRAKAQELGNHPVNIYNWVRNNVEWQPTCGGQQTADMTLDVKRGNAMDIATLTIALMRAANIPARYIHGTVDIEPDKFKNMAGDFETVETAWDFASAGGIPITGIISGGRITKVRMEHVWVEVAVNYYPSRGGILPSERNPIDSWIPLDPSFKQYEYLSGLDTETIANIDGEQLANDFMASGTVNEQEGWVQGLQASVVEQAQQQARQKLESHINSMQNPTVGDVIGGRKIVPQTLRMLPSSLPYPNGSVRGAMHNQLTSNLQVRVTLGLGWDRIDQDYQQQNTWPLYQLNQRNITISFKPATIADENALKALIPENLTDPSQLPGFLPSSIRVIPEIKRDNEVLLTQSTALALGEEIDTGYHFITPTQSYLNKKDSVIAGSYLALGIVGSNPSKKTFDKLKESLEKTKQVLESGNDSQINNLTRERLVGDMYATGIHGYYAQYMTQSRIMSLRTKTAHLPLPMAGTFGYEPNQRILFGLNRGIEKHGMYMNVRTAQAVKDHLGNGNKTKQLMLQVGMLASSLEHQVPEQLFTNPNSAAKPEGFSTAKALGMAIAQGQRIYTINQQNKAVTLQALQLDSVAMMEIRDALALGKEVTAHTTPLTISGYKGSGYVIADPVTGEGVYKISGGKNGGYLDAYDENSGWISFGLFIAGVLALAAGAAGIALVLTIILAAIAVFHALMTYMISDLHIKESGCAEGFSDLVTMVEIAAAVFGALGQVMVSAFLSFLTGGAVGAMCK